MLRSKLEMSLCHWGAGKLGIVTHPQFTDEETEAYRCSMTCRLGSSANLELNRESRNHENELASLAVLFKADLLGDK